MLSKVLSIGDKVEFTRVQAVQSDASMRKKVIHFFKIFFMRFSAPFF